jgi:hypothetical protein
VTAFEDLRGDMDARVRNDLGDSIFVELRGGATATLIGFLTSDADQGGTEGYDPVRKIWHVKLDKTAEHLALLPDGPGSILRLYHPLLDVAHKPAADSIANEGRAWVFDLQKARP